MFVRIEVATRPDFPDPPAQMLLKRIQARDPVLRKKIRWARLLDVYWLEIPRSREEIIPACQEIFQDRATQWLFTGNLIPSASGKQGGIEDLLEASPTRPGVFWGLERRLRPGVTDSTAQATIEAMRLVLGDALPGVKASTGQLLVLEGPEIRNEDLSSLARNLWCNAAFETWSFLPEHELSGNERFFQDRVRSDEAARVAPVLREARPTLQSFARRIGSAKVGTEASQAGSPVDEVIDWGVLDSSQRDARLDELSPKLGRKLTLAELRFLLESWNTPEAFRQRSARGLPRHPTLAELQVIGAAWASEIRRPVHRARFVDTDSSALPAGSAGEALPLEAGLLSSTAGATVQQNPQSWIVSGGDHRPGVLALDESLWLSVTLSGAPLKATGTARENTLLGLQGGQRSLMGSEWPSLPLAQSFVHALPSGAGASQRQEQMESLEYSTTRTQIPVLAGAEAVLTEGSTVPWVASAGLGVVVRRIRQSVRSGDRLLVLISEAAASEYREDPVFQRRSLDALAELQSLGLLSAIRCDVGTSLVPAALELAQEVGGLQAEASVLLDRREPFLLVVPPSSLAEVHARLAVWGLEVLPVGEFNESGRMLLTRRSVPVADFPVTWLWNGPPIPPVVMQSSPVLPPEPQRRSYRAPEHPPFEKRGDRILMDLLGYQSIRSPEPYLQAADVEAQGHADIKPLNAGGVGTSSLRHGPNDGAVILVGHQLIGLSEWTASEGHEVGLGVGLCQREGVREARWQAEMAVDEAVRNWLAVGGAMGGSEMVAGLAMQWFGPAVERHPVPAAELLQSFEGARDAAMELGLPILTAKVRDIDGASNGVFVCHALGRVASRRRPRSAEFKFAGDAIYVLGPEPGTLAGSRFAELFGCADPVSARPDPDWNLARRIFGWLGGGMGKEQGRIRSVHDVSDGGLLLAVAECTFARNLGAVLRMPGEVFPEAWAFGEGFHRFVISCSDADGAILENEWDSMGLPYQRIGSVTSADRLDVLGAWSVPVSELRRAWSQPGGSR